MSCTYAHVLPDTHHVPSQYSAPRSTAIRVAYKPKPESFSEQVVRLMSSRPRPRDKVIVYKAHSDRHRYDYDDAWYPVRLNHVSGKRGMSRDQIARLEKRFYSPEPTLVVNNRIHNKRYSYERERRLPPPLVLGEPQAFRTVAVSPGPGYVPEPRSDHYSRPRVHFADDIHAPYVTEIRQRR